MRMASPIDTAAALKAKMLAAFLAIEAHDAHVECRRQHLMEITSMKVPPRPLPAPIDVRKKQVIGKRRVDDPSVSMSQFYADKARFPDARDLGKTKADVNMVLLIGGLARMRRSEAQTEAAARYRSLHESAALGMSKAIDYTQARVDTSGVSANSITVNGLDARRKYRDAMQVIGMIGARVVELVVVNDMSISDAALRMGQGKGGAARERTRALLFRAIDLLIGHFNIEEVRGAGAKLAGWQDGSRQTFTRDGKSRVISTRRAG